ncbi:MAG TPA: metalloendopeptidase, partial [Sphingomonas sp.]
MRALALIAFVLMGAAPTPDRLATAKRAAVAAQARADQLAREAQAERDEADRAAADERAAAVRVAAAAAALDAARGQVALIDTRLVRQRAVLGQQQEPAARLLGAVQALARRPAIATVAQPGSV